MLNINLKNIFHTKEYHAKEQLTQEINFSTVQKKKNNNNRDICHSEKSATGAGIYLPEQDASNYMKKLLQIQPVITTVSTQDAFPIEKDVEYTYKDEKQVDNPSIPSFDVSFDGFNDDDDQIGTPMTAELAHAHIASSYPNSTITYKFKEQAELKGYKLLNKIGKGAFAVVYRAIPDPQNGKSSYFKEVCNEVAIKIIKKVDLSEDLKDHERDTSHVSSREQVLKEACLHKVASSECSEVVGFIDFVETKSYYYIVQEYLHGGEIYDQIVRLTYFSEDLTRHVIRQLAHAVKHLHSMGIIHRDIKPENLLFEPIQHIPSTHVKLRKTDNPFTKVGEGMFRPAIGGGGIGAVKLTDFGLSKQLSTETTNTPCGTISYAAPELIRNHQYDNKIDLWGIGCVLYTLLCGFPPFYADQHKSVTRKIRHGEYHFLSPWWDEISSGAKNCVKHLLEVDVSKRYNIDDLLADPWLNMNSSPVNPPIKSIFSHTNDNIDTSNVSIKRRLLNKETHDSYSSYSSLFFIDEKPSELIETNTTATTTPPSHEKYTSPMRGKKCTYSERTLFENEASSVEKFRNRINNRATSVPGLFELELNTSALFQRRCMKRETNPHYNTQTSIPLLPITE